MEIKISANISLSISSIALFAIIFQVFKEFI